MKVTLRINQVDIDVTDSQIEMASGYIDIRELDRQKNEYSKEFSFYGTPEVNVLFGHIYEINNELLSFNPTIKTDACILGDDIQLYEGYIQLLNVAINEANEAPNYVYTVKFYSKFIDFIDKIKEKSIRDLDLSDYNHDLSASNIETSWYHTWMGGYVYPLIDYNEGYGVNEANKIGIQANQLTMYPATYARLILSKIASEAGYILDFTTDFIASDDFNKLVVPYTWTDKYTINHLVGGSRTSTQSFPYSIVTPQLLTTYYNYITFDTYANNSYKLADNDIAYNNLMILAANGYSQQPYVKGTGFRAFYPGKHSILFHLHAQNNGDATTIQVVKAKGSAQTTAPEIIGNIPLAAGSTDINYFYEANLESGDIVGIRVACNSSYNIDVDILSGTTLDIWHEVENTTTDVREEVELAKTLPDINQLVFVKALKSHFNLVFAIDRDNPKKIIIKPFEEFYAGGKIVDISEKQVVNQGKVIANIFDDVYRTYNFDMASGEDSYSKEYKKKYEQNYGAYSTGITNYDFCNEEAYEVKDETFALIHNDDIITGATPAIYTFIVPRLMNSDSTFIDTATTPRFAYYNGLVGGTGWHFNDYRLQKIYLPGIGATVCLPYTVTYGYPGYSYSSPNWVYTHPLISTCLYPTDMANANNLDLGFGQEHGHYYTATACTTTCYTKYYKNMIDWITSPTTKRVTVTRILDYVDIYNLDLNDVIYLDDTYYLIEEYAYNISTKECEFTLLTNPFIDVQYGKAKPFFPRPTPGVVVKPGIVNVSPNLNLSNNVLNNTNINVGNNVVIGTLNDGGNTGNNIIIGHQNFISERSTNNIVTGSNNKISEDSTGNVIVGSDNVYVPTGTTGAFVFGISDTGYTATSRSFIVSSDTVVFSSNTITFNNVPISAITSSVVWTTGSTGTASIKAINSSSVDATANYAVAEGQATKAGGIASHAEGRLTSTVGNYTHSEGLSTTAKGDNSHSEGNTTTAGGQASHAEGYSTNAAGDCSHAEGSATVASGNYSHVGGINAIASGLGSFCHANDSEAAGTNTVVLAADGVTGNDNYTLYTDNIVVTAKLSAPSIYSGSTNLNSIFSPTSHEHIDLSDVLNVNTTYRSVYQSGCTATGTSSFAEGYLTTAAGAYSHAEGYNTTSNGYANHVEGAFNKFSSNQSYYCHIEGYGCYIYDNTGAGIYSSHVEGFSTKVFVSVYGPIVQGNHYEGYNCSGYTVNNFEKGNHIEGCECIIGSDSYTFSDSLGNHIEGYQTTILRSGNAFGNHAEGHKTLVSAEYAAHAEGRLCTASGNYSHAGGYNSVAAGSTSFVHGTTSKASGTGTAVIAANGVTGTTDYTLYTDNLRVTSSVSAGTISANTIYAGGVNIGKSYITLPVCMTDSSFTPTDSATYYFGNAGVSTTTATSRRIYIWKAGTIRVATIWSYATTAGSNENISMYIRKNNSTDTLIQTEGAAAVARNWENTSLAITVASGDYIEVKMVCPAWGTNPVFNALGGYIVLETFE